MISNIRLGKKKLIQQKNMGFSPLKCDESHFWNMSFLGNKSLFQIISIPINMGVSENSGVFPPNHPF